MMEMFTGDAVNSSCSLRSDTVENPFANHGSAGVNDVTVTLWFLLRKTCEISTT